MSRNWDKISLELNIGFILYCLRVLWIIIEYKDCIITIIDLTPLLIIIFLTCIMIGASIYVCIEQIIELLK